LIWPVLLSAGIGAATFVGLHVLWWRCSASNNPRIGLLFVLAIIGVAVSFTVGILVCEIVDEARWALLWIDVLLVVLYFFLYAGIVRSVSLTLLTHLRQGGHQSLELQSIIDEYSTSSRFEDRIRLMHESGFVKVSGEFVILTKKGRLLAQSAKGMSRLLGTVLEG